MVWCLNKNSKISKSFSEERDLEAPEVEQTSKCPNQSNPDLNETDFGYNNGYPKFNSIWVNPFQKMEPHERNLRIFFFSGIFPLPLLGCLIGSLYGSVLGKKKKRIHDKLHRANILCCIFYLFFGAILGSIFLFYINNTPAEVPKTVTRVLQSDGNEFYLKVTDNGFKNNLLLVEHGSGILPEVISEAEKYKFNVIHATVVEQEDMSVNDDEVWKTLISELKIEPKDTVLVTTVEEEKAEDLKDANLDQWLGMLFINEVADKNETDKFMVQFINKKLICNGKETWMFSNIRPAGSPNYFISRDEGLRVLTEPTEKPSPLSPSKERIVSISDKTSFGTGEKLEGVKMIMESVNSENPINEDLVDSICAMSNTKNIPSNRYVKL